MAQLIVRRIDDDAEERLKVPARRHGRGLEAEVRDILEAAAREPVPSKEPGFGTRMRERFAKRGLTRKEAAAFERAISELRSR